MDRCCAFRIREVEANHRCEPRGFWSGDTIRPIPAAGTPAAVARGSKGGAGEQSQPHVGGVQRDTELGGEPLLPQMSPGSACRRAPVCSEGSGAPFGSVL